LVINLASITVNVTVVTAPANLTSLVTLVSGLVPLETLGVHLESHAKLGVKGNLPLKDAVLKGPLGVLGSPLVIVHTGDVVITMTAVTVAGRGGHVGVKGVGHERTI